jgi:hypothetical protein
MLTVQHLNNSRSQRIDVRCPVTVHQFSDRTLGVTYQGQLLARYELPRRAPPHSTKKERRINRKDPRPNTADIFNCL